MLKESDRNLATSNSVVSGMYKKVLSLHKFWMSAFVLLSCQQLTAQTSTLSKPTRTVYKCSIDNKVTYSDEPCVGAERIDVEPTRGLNKSTGREIIGQDVAREKNRELTAEAVKPITGMNSKQFEVQTKRVHLSPEIKTECMNLDHSIAENEAKENVAQGDAKRQIQQSLFVLRKRYRELKC